MLVQRNRLYVADTENHALREVDLRAKTVKTLAGEGPLWKRMWTTVLWLASPA
jgi:hypothetical protein